MSVSTVKMKVWAVFFVCLTGVCLGFEDKTIVEWLTDDGNYNTLVTAVKAAGLTAALSGKGPLTIFAPSDAVFNRLGSANINSLLQNPTQLAGILQYHVINEFLVVPMVTKETYKITLQRGKLDIAPNNGGLIINNNAKVSASQNDIVVNNGVIQPIDGILLPQSLPTFTIAQFLIEEDLRFKDLTVAVQLAGLTSVLEGGDYTLFAPVDRAWNPPNGTANLVDPTTPDAKPFFQEILKYHLVPGTKTAGQLTDGQVLNTVHGTNLAVTVNSTGVFINNSTVIDPDLACTNGIVHAIDRVLFPIDIIKDQPTKAHNQG